MTEFLTIAQYLALGLLAFSIWAYRMRDGK